MYELKKNGKVFTYKFVGTGPSPYEKRIYRAAVSQRLRNTDLVPKLMNEVVLPTLLINAISRLLGIIYSYNFLALLSSLF